jgi:rubredoxin
MKCKNKKYIFLPKMLLRIRWVSNRIRRETKEKAVPLNWNSPVCENVSERTL